MRNHYVFIILCIHGDNTDADDANDCRLWLSSNRRTHSVSYGGEGVTEGQTAIRVAVYVRESGRIMSRTEYKRAHTGLVIYRPTLLLFFVNRLRGFRSCRVGDETVSRGVLLWRLLVEFQRGELLRRVRSAAHRIRVVSFVQLGLFRIQQRVSTNIGAGNTNRVVSKFANPLNRTSLRALHTGHSWPQLKFKSVNWLSG